MTFMKKITRITGTPSKEEKEVIAAGAGVIGGMYVFAALSYLGLV